MPFGIDSDDIRFHVEKNMKFGVNVGYVQPDYVRSDSVRYIQTMTQEEYDALENPDPKTIYVIITT